MAVRHHDHLPFLLCAGHDRSLNDRRRIRDRLAASPQPRDAAADQVLRQALHDQLRPRPGHRHRPGVPVRDELERLLKLRRRHLRRTSGDRGPARVLPGVHLPGPVDLWVGQAPCQASRGLYVARGSRHLVVGLLHPRSQLLHAAPRRLPLQPGDRSRRDDRLLSRTDQQGPAGDVPAHIDRRVHGRWRSGHGGWPVAPAQAGRRQQRPHVPARHPCRRVGHPCGRCGRHGLRRPPGQGHDRGPADEDGLSRGPVQHRGQQCAVLAVDDRLAGRK